MTIENNKNRMITQYRTAAIAVFVVLVVSFSLHGQTPNNNDNTVDKNLRSSARINPATLAMEFSLPLANYPGRAGSSVPIAFSYSSKVWSMRRWQFWHNENGGWGTQQQPFLVTNITEFMPIFGKDTFGGWTSGLRGLEIVPDEENYVVNGSATNSFVGSASDGGNETWNCVLDSSTTVFDSACYGGFRTHENWNCEEPQQNVTHHTVELDYCVFGPNDDDDGGIIWLPGDNEDPPPPPPVTYPNYKVNQFRVNFPDGTSGTFRKDDKVYDCNVYEECLAAYSRDGSFIAVDGSGARLVVGTDATRLFNPDGSRWEISSRDVQTYIDKNGNKLTFDLDTQTWTDTKGNQIVNPLWTPNVSLGNHQFDLPAMSGQTPQAFSQTWNNLKPTGCSTGTESACDNAALEDPTEALSSQGTDVCGNRYQDQPTTLSSLFTVEAPRNTNQPDEHNKWYSTTTKERLCGATAFNPILLTEVTYPGGSKYRFRYNKYGELSKIVYPSGSYERFRYDKIQPLTFLDYPIDAANRGVVERWVSEDGQNVSQHWTYSAGGGLSSQTNPDGSRIDTKYLLGFAPFGMENPLNGQVSEVKTYATDGTTLKSRVLNDYVVTAARTGGDVRATRDARVSRSVSISFENGKALATLTENEYDENGSSDPEFFSDLNVKRKKSYNYVVVDPTTAENGSLETIAGLFASATPAAVTETDYVYNTDYKARGILGLPVETRVMNPANLSGPPLSKTQIVYDNALPASNANYPYSMQSYGTGNSMDCSADQTPKICWQNPNGASGNIDLAYRGLPTTTRTWSAETNSWIETHTQYDQFGNAVKVKDALGNEATTSFDAQYKYAYPTSTTAPAPDPSGTHGTSDTATTHTTYDFTTGLPLSVTDDFNQVSTTEYDGMLRPIRVNPIVVNGQPTGPKTETIYGTPDSNGQFSASERFVKVRKQLDANNWDEATTWFDGLGRTIKTQAKDSQGDVFVETHYDEFGRVDRVTNPYRAGDTVYWSKTRYDNAGRDVETYAPTELANLGSAQSLGITSFDISTVNDSSGNFVGTVVMTTDASGRKSRSITNALSQLLRVDEPTAIGGSETDDLGSLASPAQPTVYFYDVFGKMVRVQQGVQNRYFKYDSLGRLLRINQPEQEVNAYLDLSDSFNTTGHWTAGFAYDISGNVVRATDANGVNIVNEYDKANRVVKRCYTKPNINTTATNCAQIASNEVSTDTPAVEFWYDGKGLATQQSPNYAKGKLTKVDNGISSTEYMTFDNFGRLTRTRQMTDGVVYGDDAHPMTYSYNLSGALVQETYPSGRIVKNELESDGDLARIHGTAKANAADRIYASVFKYTPDGRIESLRLGNNLWEKAQFNTRLQVKELALGHLLGAGDVWKLGYEYGEIDSNGNVDSTKNTGNIARQTLSFDGLTPPFVQSYKYDSLYRLTDARETSGTGTSAPQTWQESYGYDRYGNRTSHANFTGTTSFAPTGVTDPSIDPTSNRFNANQGYGYDKNGNLIADAESRAFTFNADNKQSKVVQNGNLVAEYFFDGEGKRVKKKVYDPNNSTIVTEETVFVYSSGKLIAEYSSAPAAQNPTTSYTATDMLGSPRVITDSFGNVVTRRDFRPFGEQVGVDGSYRTNNFYASGTADNVRQKFTGYQKDNETNLDFAEARMYENRHGRFTAVDPLIASGKSEDPQTFNRYVYCGNNPLSCVDPSGQDGFWAYRVFSGNYRSYRHFNSQQEMDDYNKVNDTEFCKDNPSCVKWQPWTGGNWILWDDRTGGRLNDNGTISEFSLQGYGTDEQWRELVDAWYSGKGFSEAWQKVFEIALDKQGRTGLSDTYDLTLGRATGESFGSFTGNLQQEKLFQALPMLAGPLQMEANIARTARNGLFVDGLSNEFRLQYRHFAGSSTAGNHVFNDVSTYSQVETSIFEKGIFTGVTFQGKRAWARFGLRFESPIGYRLGPNGERTPLSYGELKLDLNTGGYHIIPRTRPRQ